MDSWIASMCFPLFWENLELKDAITWFSKITQASDLDSVLGSGNW
jgi:hypothetical protein